MGIIQAVRGLFEKKSEEMNLIRIFNSAENYIFVFPDDEFFVFLMLEPIINISKTLKERRKKLICIIGKQFPEISKLLECEIFNVDFENRTETTTLFKRLHSDYKNSAYIYINSMKNASAERFISRVKATITVSVGVISEKCDIAFPYHRHYEAFVKSLYKFFCVSKRSVGGYLQLRKNKGRGICINKNLFERYRGEKIMKPLIIDAGVERTALELGKIINKCEYVVSYRDRLTAIGYLLKKKVICVTEDVENLPNGVDYCHGSGGEIDYFIE